MTAQPAGTRRQSAAWVASDYWEMAKRSLAATGLRIEPPAIPLNLEYLLITYSVCLE